MRRFVLICSATPPVEVTLGYPIEARQSFQHQNQVGSLVESALKEHLRGKDDSWHTTVRVKSEESFFEKIQTGRFGDGADLEDFVGAMIVVPSTGDIKKALAFVKSFFTIDARRPQSSRWTSKPADTFRFDDLRLYGHLTHTPDVPDGPMYAAKVEIQIKTFLQHAWSVATHDLIYKYDKLSWPRSRVAAHVKALLEHAELSISSIDALETSGALPPAGQPEKRLGKILVTVQADWPASDLPENLKRLAENLDALGSACGCTDVPAMLERGKTELSGHPDGWSPYECLADYLSRYEADAMRAALQSQESRAISIWVTPDILRRLGLSRENAANAVP